MFQHVTFPVSASEKNCTSHDATSADRKGGLNRRALLSGAAMLPVLPAVVLGNAQNAAADQDRLSRSQPKHCSHRNSGR